MEFVLDAADAQWVQETIQKTGEELRQTTPSGRALVDPHATHARCVFSVRGSCVRIH